MNLNLTNLFLSVMLYRCTCYEFCMPSLNMALQAAFLTESRTTHNTFVGPVPCVGHIVPLEVLGCHEALATASSPGAPIRLPLGTVRGMGA